MSIQLLPSTSDAETGPEPWTPAHWVMEVTQILPNWAVKEGSCRSLALREAGELGRGAHGARVWGGGRAMGRSQQTKV